MLSNLEFNNYIIVEFPKPVFPTLRATMSCGVNGGAFTPTIIRANGWNWIVAHINTAGSTINVGVSVMKCTQFDEVNFYSDLSLSIPLN